MAHKRKDTLFKVPEWAKHLRPFIKSKVAKGERRMAQKEIDKERNKSNN